MQGIRLVQFCSCFLVCVVICAAQYQPTWESLDKHPLPQWYDDAKFGIFLHWGVYSVPGYCGAWLWYRYTVDHVANCQDFIKNNYPPNFVYGDFASQFKAEFYNPKEWAEIFKAAGAKYVVLTSKHHEGFSLWPNSYGFNWNSMDVGPKRDLVGDLADAIRNFTDIKFGLYHSLLEWFNPLFLKDQANKFKTDTFVQSKTMPELYEIVNKYKPDVIWSDGDWAGGTDYWKSKEFIAWLYNESPVKDTVVVNDRWGAGSTCKHGDIFTCTDKYNPKTLQKHKWENCMTVDKDFWAYQRDIQLSRILSAEDLVKTLVETVSCGGNLLMDVGPTADGRITPIFEERLRQVGAWLDLNGEGIYKSRPWKYQNDTFTPDVWYTQQTDEKKQVTVYAFVFNWPRSGVLTLGSPVPTPSTTVNLLGYKDNIKWQGFQHGKMVLQLPLIPFYDMPSQFVWTFKMTNLK